MRDIPGNAWGKYFPTLLHRHSTNGEQQEVRRVIFIEKLYAVS